MVCRLSVVICLMAWMLVCAVVPASASAPAVGSVSTQTAPEKSFRRSSAVVDRQLEETYLAGEELLATGRVDESLEKFGIVAKLATEPLKSRALLKFGFAASILERKREAKSALTGALQTTASGAEGRDIRAFARRILDSSDPFEMLTAPPKHAGRFFSVRPSVPPVSDLWDRVRDIETLGRKGRLSAAVRHYRDLISLYPEHPVLLNNLALLLAEGSDPVEAEALIRKAFKCPGAEKYLEYLYDTLGYAHLKQGKVSDSIENFRRSISMRETPERDLHMAQALDAIGQPDAARQYRARAGALDVTGLAGR